MKVQSSKFKVAAVGTSTARRNAFFSNTESLSKTINFQIIVSTFILICESAATFFSMLMFTVKHTPGPSQEGNAFCSAVNLYAIYKFASNS